MSKTDTPTGSDGLISVFPTSDVNPSAWPISCVATASKSNLSGSIPSPGSKSNENPELNPMEGGAPSWDCSAVGSATGFNNPSARKFATGQLTTVVEPRSVGTEAEGSELYSDVSCGLTAEGINAVRTPG